MNEELARLEAELEKVKGCGLEYLPEYGFSSKRGNHAAYTGGYKRITLGDGMHSKGLRY